MDSRDPKKEREQSWDSVQRKYSKERDTGMNERSKSCLSFYKRSAATCVPPGNTVGYRCATICCKVVREGATQRMKGSEKGRTREKHAAINPYLPNILVSPLTLTRTHHLIDCKADQCESARVTTAASQVA